MESSSRVEPRCFRPCGTETFYARLNDHCSRSLPSEVPPELGFSACVLDERRVPDHQPPECTVEPPTQAHPSKRVVDGDTPGISRCRVDPAHDCARQEQRVAYDSQLPYDSCRAFQARHP